MIRLLLTLLGYKADGVEVAGIVRIQWFRSQSGAIRIKVCEDII